MNLPNTLHPTTFNIAGIRIRVAAYFELTDKQAAVIAMHTFRSRKWTKKDAQKVHLQYWTGDRENLALLEPQPSPSW